MLKIAKTLILFTIISSFINVKSADVKEFSDAIKFGKYQIVENLINKFNVNEIRIKIGNKDLPALIAATHFIHSSSQEVNENPYYRMIKLFLEKKADVNIKDNENRTAIVHLFKRVTAGGMNNIEFDTLKLLLSHGADLVPLYEEQGPVSAIGLYLNSIAQENNPNDKQAIELLLHYGLGYTKNGKLILSSKDKKPYLSIAYKKPLFKEIIDNFFDKKFKFVEPAIVQLNVRNLSQEQKREILDYLKSIKNANIDESLDKIATQIKDKTVGEILLAVFNSALNKRIFTGVKTEDQKKADEEFLNTIQRYIWAFE